MKFVKMHGCGNDYVYLDAVTQPTIAVMVDAPGWAQLVQRMSDRHKGIGSDGVIVVGAPAALGQRDHASVRMRMFNSDGSESEMCGNGVRCVAKFAHDRLGIRSKPMHVQTGRGVLPISYEVANGRVTVATVDMGEPILDLADIPVDPAQVTLAANAQYTLRDEAGLLFSFVSMGNPHAVIIESHPGQEPQPLEFIRCVGPRLEVHPAFPNRTNVHLVQVRDRQHASVFTWERGAGITQACGTGACASLVAGVRAGLLDRDAVLTVLGGQLRIRWDEATNHVFMTGEAVDVFEGDWPD